MDAVRAAISVPGGGRFADLTKVSRQLASLGSLDEIYESAIRLGRDVLGFDRLSVWLVDPEDTERCVGTFGVDEKGNIRDERSRSFRLESGGLSIYSDPIVVNHDVDLLNDKGEVIGHGASAFVVMWDGNDIIGLMTCDNLLTKHSVTEECRELLVMYAMALAALISKRRAEAALVEKERLFETIFDNAQIGIAQVAPDSSWIRVNQRLAEMLGYSKEELIGRNFRDVTHADDLAHNWELFQQAASGQRDRYEMIKRYVRKDGTEIWGHLNARAVVADSGRLLYMISAVLDITDQVAAEAEVRSVNQRLEAKVEERTAELSSALENLESFSYSVSHDLRGPLRAMNGFSRILLEDYGERLDDEGRSYLERIASASNRMAGLIDALLSLGRISRTELRREDLNLRDLFDEFVVDLGPHAFGGQLSIEPVTVHADRNLARVALANLYENAVKFTRNLGEKARITVSVVESGHGTALQISDNGVGFPPHAATQLFRPFHRLHDEKEFPGTGIGLATVERIVKRHGGHIWAVSKPGEGAEFCLTLGPGSIIRDNVV